MDTDAEIADLKRRLSNLESLPEEVKNIQRVLLESLDGAGPYDPAGTPTAEGVIPMTYRGQRFNILAIRV